MAPFTVILSALFFVSLADAFCIVSVHPRDRTSSLALQAVFGGQAKTRKARDLIQSLVQEQECFSSQQGAEAFGEACAVNVVYEDRFEPQPFVGKTVRKT